MVAVAQQFYPVLSAENSFKHCKYWGENVVRWGDK